MHGQKITICEFVWYDDLNLVHFVSLQEQQELSNHVIQGYLIKSRESSGNYAGV